MKRTLSILLSITMLPILSFSSVSADIGGESPSISESHVMYVTHNAQTGLDTYSSFVKEPPAALKNAVLSEPGFEGLDTEPSIIPASVIGKDDRKPVSNYKAKPYSCICLLKVKWPNGRTTYGTGWLFKADGVATAGHCVYNKERGGWADTITVYPGRNGDNLPYSSATAVNMGVATPYTDNRDANYDYGLLKLSSSIGNQCGWLGYTYNGGKKGGSIRLIGYPGDLPSENGTGKYQYESTGTIQSLTENRLFYDADSFDRQSGSPLIYGSTVIGVHTQGTSTQNKGKRIHYDMYEWMKEW